MTIVKMEGGYTMIGIKYSATNYGGEEVEFMVYKDDEERFNIGDTVTVEVTVKK